MSITLEEATSRRRILKHKFDATNSAIESLDKLNTKYGNNPHAETLYVQWLDEAQSLYQAIRSLNEYIFVKRSEVIG